MFCEVWIGPYQIYTHVLLHIFVWCNADSILYREIFFYYFGCNTKFPSICRGIIAYISRRRESGVLCWKFEYSKQDAATKLFNLIILPLSDHSIYHLVFYFLGFSFLKFLISVTLFYSTILRQKFHHRDENFLLFYFAVHFFLCVKKFKCFINTFLLLVGGVMSFRKGKEEDEENSLWCVQYNGKRLFQYKKKISSHSASIVEVAVICACIRRHVHFLWKKNVSMSFAVTCS